MVEQGLYKTKEECEINNPTFEIECELYYEKHCGLFAVESDAVENNCTIYSPYSGDIAEDFD